VTAFARGTLSDTNSDSVPDTVATASRSQTWSFDALGNWSSVTTDGTAQSRTHNQQNEVTAAGSATLTFDGNGNTTTDDAGRTLVYDAWNRLVQVKSGSTVLASFAPDALGRRVVENTGTAHDLYYSAAWQVLEERISGVAYEQYVWSSVYVDALVERDRDADANSSNGLEERLYAQQDANWNVTALVDTSGNVKERYAYDPYGSVTYLTAAWGTFTSSMYAWVYLHQATRYVSVAGLYNQRMRDQSPTLGRWMQNDPLRYHAGDNNLYRDEENGPTNETDPSGLGNGYNAYGSGRPKPNQPYVRPEDRPQLTLKPTIGLIIGAYKFGWNFTSSITTNTVILPNPFMAWDHGSVIFLMPGVSWLYTVALDYRGYTNAGVNSAPATVMSVANNFPFTGSIISIVEMWDGWSLRPHDVGRPLGGWDYVSRGIGVALDAAFWFFFIRGIWTSPKPPTPTRPGGLNGLVFDANAAPVTQRATLVRGALQGKVRPGWTFMEAVGTDGTHVFYGETGPAIIIRPNGTVVRGVVPPDLRARLIPTPRNPCPKPPFTIDDLTIDP
jgi:RHS repeat-associated protein